MAFQIASYRIEDTVKENTILMEVNELSLLSEIVG